MLQIVNLGLPCIRLESALSLNTCAVNEFLTFLSALCISVQIVEFGVFVALKFTRALVTHHFLIFNNFLACFTHRWLESQPFSFLSKILNSEFVLLFLDSFAIFDQKLFRPLIINSPHICRNLVDLWMETESFHLLSILLWSCSLNCMLKFFLAFHSFFIKNLAVVDTTSSRIVALGFHLWRWIESLSMLPYTSTIKCSSTCAICHLVLTHAWSLLINHHSILTSRHVTRWIVQRVWSSIASIRFGIFAVAIL